MPARALDDDRADTPLLDEPDQHGDAERRQQRQGAELGGGGEADRGTREDVVRHPAVLDEPHQSNQRDEHDHGEEDVGRHVVRVLHVQNAGAEQEGGEQADSRTVEPPAEEEEQQDRQRPGHGADAATDEDRLVVAAQGGNVAEQRW